MTSEPTLRMAIMAFSVICVIWGIAKGVGRLVKFTVAAAAGGAAGWAFFRYAPGPLISWLKGFHGEAIQWGAIICGVLAFWFTHRFLASLFNGPSVSPVGGGARARAGVFSLVPALLLIWAVAMGIRYSGSVTRMSWVEEAAKNQRTGELKTTPILAQLRHGVTSGLLGEILDRVDPLHSRETSALGALLAVRHSESAWQNLIRQPRVAALLKMDAIRPLLRDNEVQHALSFSHYSKLLTLPGITGAATSPAVREALRALPVDDAIRAAISGTPALPLAPRATIVR